MFELTLINRAGLVVVGGRMLTHTGFCLDSDSVCLYCSWLLWTAPPVCPCCRLMIMVQSADVLPLQCAPDEPQLSPNSNSVRSHTSTTILLQQNVYIYFYIYTYIYIYFFYYIFFYEVINNPSHKFPCFFLEVLNIGKITNKISLMCQLFLLNDNNRLMEAFT